jgi:hypothetical protein
MDDEQQDKSEDLLVLVYEGKNGTLKLELSKNAGSSVINAVVPQYFQFIKDMQ